MAAVSNCMYWPQQATACPLLTTVSFQVHFQRWPMPKIACVVTTRSDTRACGHLDRAGGDIPWANPLSNFSGGLLNCSATCNTTTGCVGFVYQGDDAGAGCEAQGEELLSSTRHADQLHGLCSGRQRPRPFRPAPFAALSATSHGKYFDAVCSARTHAPTVCLCAPTLRVLPGPTLSLSAKCV
jgi:hypothetical protein